MESPLGMLQRRMEDDWLIGYDGQELIHLTCYARDQLTDWSKPPTLLLAERHPLKFLAGFLAACTAQCPVFLANPDWGEMEWQQALAIAQPDLIWRDGVMKAWGDGVMGKRGNRGAPQGGIMIPTGGSSGNIRFATHTWETLVAAVKGFQQYFDVTAINSCCVLPLYHVSGLMQFLRSFTTDGQFALVPFKMLQSGDLAIDPAAFFLSLVPTQLQRLLQTPNTIPLSAFRTIFLGGSPAWPELLERARQQQIRLAPSYGMTETAAQIATLKPADFLQGKQGCGQVLPHARVLVQGASGAVLSTGEIGAIAIQSTSLALGYYPNYFSASDYRPDDLGFFDAEGYLHIVGRNSDKIITGGENVFPVEVEAAIRATGLVADVCVIGCSDREWGQMVTAVYVPTHRENTPSHLKSALAGRLSKFKQPKQWVEVLQIPRNAQGKVNRQVLAALVSTATGKCVVDKEGNDGTNHCYEDPTQAKPSRCQGEGTCGEQGIERTTDKSTNNS